jgi:serine/threonine protein kinase
MLVADFTETPSPFFLMPYFKLGNLEQKYGDRDIPEEVAITILIETLEALAYLHLRGVAHRDLKPANILVASEDPFHITVADFGLATDKSSLKTVCGTHIYAAPEVYSGKHYTPSVDLWSLGVIVLQYVYGLPQEDQPRYRKHKRIPAVRVGGRAWCNCIVDYANDWESDGLIDLLTTGMLRIDPDKRLSAGDCLEKAYSFGPFHDGPLNSGSATPTQQAVLGGAMRTHDDSATIILGRLWGRDEVSNHDKNNQTGTAFEHCVGNLSPLVDPPASRLDNQSTSLLSYKRYRSPAAPAKQSSSDGPVKRRQSGVLCTGRTGSRTYLLSGQYLEQGCESTQFRSMHDDVLALLRDLCLEESSSLVRDDRVTTLVENICQWLVRLNITQIGCDEQPHSVNVTITLPSDCRKMVLASFTPSERMNSMADMAAHLLHMLQLRSPVAQMADDPPFQTGSMKTTNRPQDRPINRVDSQATRANAVSNGVPGPAALPSYPSSIPQPMLPRNEPAVEPISLPQDVVTIPRQRCYMFDGAMYWPWMVHEKAIYVCESPKRINAAHLLKAAGLSRPSLQGVLRICGVTSTWTWLSLPGMITQLGTRFVNPAFGFAIGWNQ